VKDNGTFKQVKSIVFGKHDEELFNQLSKEGYFDRNWNNKIKDLIKADFYGRKENNTTFTQEQEKAIIDIIKRHFSDFKFVPNEDSYKEVVAEREVIDKSNEAIQALNNLQKFRKK
jgi:hypothetical protein